MRQRTTDEFDPNVIDTIAPRHLDKPMVEMVDAIGRDLKAHYPDLVDANLPLVFNRAGDLHDHPRETVENGVDIGHFAIVRGYSSVDLRQDLLIEGPHFHVSYAAREFYREPTVLDDDRRAHAPAVVAAEGAVGAGTAP